MMLLTAAVALMSTTGSCAQAGASASVRAICWGCGSPARRWGSSAWAGSAGPWRRARGFDMRLSHSRNRLPPELEQGAVFRIFQAMLPHCDFCPCMRRPTGHRQNHQRRGPRLTAAWRRVRECLARWAGRRGRLIHALTSGQLFAAGLDVFRASPTTTCGLPAGQRVLSPHIGSATVETRNAMGSARSTTSSRCWRGGGPIDPLWVWHGLGNVDLTWPTYSGVLMAMPATSWPGLSQGTSRSLRSGTGAGTDSRDKPGHDEWGRPSLATEADFT